MAGGKQSKLILVPDRLFAAQLELQTCACSCNVHFVSLCLMQSGPSQQRERLHCRAAHRSFVCSAQPRMRVPCTEGSIPQYIYLLEGPIQSKDSIAGGEDSAGGRGQREQPHDDERGHCGGGPRGQEGRRGSPRRHGRHGRLRRHVLSWVPPLQAQDTGQDTGQDSVAAPTMCA